jgi:hypothetical protein
MTTKTNSVHRMRFRTVAALAVLAGSFAFAADIQPPPPSVSPETAQVSVPKVLQQRFFEVIYPAYIEWLAVGDDAEDTLANFRVYLALNGVGAWEQFCYTALYMSM